MKRLISVAVAGLIVAGVSVAAAQPGWGPMAGRGPGWMMQGGGGPMMQGGGGPGMCAGFGAAAATSEAITEEKATALATEYAAKHFKGYTVERVLPFEGRFRTAYQVELKGPKGEARVLHVSPWGAVRPFAPLAAAR